MVAQLSTMPSIKYGGLIGNWTLEQYVKIDKPFTKLYRKAMQQRDTFPTALVYGPRNMCDAGNNRLSDIIQNGKWSLVQRLSDKDSAGHHAIKCLLDNSSRRRGCRPRQGDQRTLIPTVKGKITHGCKAYSGGLRRAEPTLASKGGNLN